MFVLFINSLHHLVDRWFTRHFEGTGFFMFFVSVSPFAHGHSQGHLSTWMPSICCMALEGVSMSVRELPISPRLGRRVSLPPQSVRKDGHSLPHSQPLKGAPPATTRETRSRALWRSAARVAEASGRSACSARACSAPKGDGWPRDVG